MKTASLKLPHLLFVYTAIVLAALLCLCMLYVEKAALEQDLLKLQKESSELRSEMEILCARYYGTSPEVIAAVDKESKKYGINPAIMLELIKWESDFDPKAVSPSGAIGICQLMPSTAREIAGELGVDYREELLYDCGYNIALAAYYLGKLLTINDYDYHKALTAYNMGPTGLKEHMARTGTAVSRFSLRVSRQQ
ncbi:MAG: transglycosylase SLT domain-containing protein [Peptococcaceae bacterium]|nr:transglycosylase SLT domain-containing protein [Peptococcaceae bacterium]MDH7524516.1 transglycosylase SLT domain-containing protein [Peptococcaceae bacterium]